MASIFTQFHHVTRRYTRRAHLRLDDLLIDLYQERQPGALNLAASHTVQELRSLLILYSDGLNGCSQIWEGPEIETGQPMRVAYVADSRAIRVLSPEYLHHILFQNEAVQVRDINAFPMTASRREAQSLAHEADLVIVEQNPLLHWQPQSGAFVAMMPWVRMVFEMDPSEPWGEIEQRMHGQKSNIKMAKKNEFQLRISHEDADFDHFYEHMHIPMVRERHGSYGWVENKEGARQMFRHGMLMLIETPDGQPVCGHLAIQHGKLAFAVINGTLDGDHAWHDRGALSALYYHSIRWFYERGVERYDFGECRPFQTDGLYNYKARWGMTTSRNPWTQREWIFWTPRNSPVATQWIESHPPVKL